MNAVDPASLCGIRLESLKGTFPAASPRPTWSIAGNSLWWSRAGTARPDFLHLPPTTPASPSISPFSRCFSPVSSARRKVLVETINGKPALESEYPRR